MPPAFVPVVVVVVAVPVTGLVFPSSTFTNVVPPDPVVTVVAIAVMAIDPYVAPSRRGMFFDDGGRRIPWSVDDHHRALRGGA